MKRAIKGALLSGLAFPGLGQIALKSYPKGLAFMALALAMSVLIVKTTVDDVIGSLQSLDPALVSNLPATPGDHTGMALWILGLCWLWSILDAYRIGDRQDRQV